MVESQGKYAGPPGYVLLEKVGVSQTGAIFKARHVGRGHLVAVKFLTRAATANHVSVRRFQRTIRILSELHHPNLIRALDASWQDGAQYLVMDYIHGMDLRTFLKASGPLPIVQAVDFASQAAAGLSYLHDSGICHRNIKPANLLLDAVECKVKIIGLGLAHIKAGMTLGGEAFEDDLAPQGEIVGTSEYMSPEQAIDSNKIDARADIYSLGCTLHTLLTGHPPDVGRLAGNSQQAIPSLALSRPDAPPALDRIVQKMLARHPEDRYPSMIIVWAELGSALGVPPDKSPSREPALPVFYLPAIPSASVTQTSVPPEPSAPPVQAQMASASQPMPENLQFPPEVAPSNGFDDLIGSYQAPVRKRAVSVKKKKKPPTAAYLVPVILCLISALVVSIFIVVNNRQSQVVARSTAPTVAHDSSDLPKPGEADIARPGRKSIAEEIAESQRLERENGKKAATKPSQEKETPKLDDPPKPVPVQDETKPATPEPPKEAIARRPIPTQAERERALKNFQLGYQGEIESAKNPDDKCAFARKLIGNASDAGVDPVDRYVMLEQALVFAKSANDLEVASDAVESIAKDYEVDQWQAKLDVVAALCDGKASRAKPEPLVEAVLSLRLQAMEKHLFAVADALSDHATKASKTSKDRDLRNRIQSAKNESVYCLKWQCDYSTAQQTLKSQPQDANANLIAGKYECFILEEWDAGLPKLKIAMQGPQADLINLDIKRPTDPTEQADLGGQWCEFAKSIERTKDKPFQSSIYRRARFWYDKALENASGLLKTRVQNAIEKLPGGERKTN